MQGWILALGACGLAGSVLSPPAARAYTQAVIYSFCSDYECHDGHFPESAPVIAPNGKLYGATFDGGFKDTGVIYELAFDTQANKWKQKTIYSFCSEDGCVDGGYPRGRLVVDIRGNLYGVAEGVGGGAGEVVFELMHGRDGQWTITILYHFCSLTNCIDGSDPEAGLSYAGAATGVPYDGKAALYGTTYLGGSHGDGTVFVLKRKKSGWSERVIYDFCSQANCADGGDPESGVTLDSNGNLFGVAGVGINGYGVLYELNPSGSRWAQTVLHNFCELADCSDGAWPDSEPVLDASGALFGTTPMGGREDCCGILYKLVPNGAHSLYSVLYNFCSQRNCKDGNEPDGPLTIDGSGNLLGTARFGGGHNSEQDDNGSGTAFNLNGSLRPVYRFCSRSRCLDGAEPRGGLVADASGRLFGVTEIGGDFNGGSVFELVP